MEIKAESKILELFKAYPGLEDKLIELFPVFSNLKNPVMRSTVARFATVNMVSERVGKSADGFIEIIKELIGGVNKDC